MDSIITWREGRETKTARRLTVAGSSAALATMAVLTFAMLPFRGDLSIATTALVLVVPVVVGVVIGGFPAGVVSVVGGFLVYDFFFIPPYLTLDVGASENWVALGVYAVIMVPVARVVASMNVARAQARQRAAQIRQLFELSALLVEDKPLDELLAVIVTALRDVFDAHQVALLLPRNDDLEIAASAGAPLTEDDRRRLQPSPGRLASLDAERPDRTNPFGIALVAAGRPVGMLTVSGTEITGRQREPLLLFANQIALAVERAQLREHALRAGLTEEVERLARTLVAAVSHDLRAPLASIKASSSILADPQLSGGLGRDGRHELAVLVDTQVDRLAALVTNLLDMSRVQAGMLQPRASITHLHDLVDTVLADLPAGRRDSPPVLDLPDDLPLIDVDVVLIARVLTNLLENAIRHSPKESPITIAAARADPTTIAVSVTDHGPGISPDRRGEIFGLFLRRKGDSGSGLGLAIAKTFVDAHRQRIWVEDAPGGGARFCFTLPVAAPLQERSCHAGRADHRR
ncbi:sensor histidine kinase [Planotetraspora kaengkrachanensis]|nr:ATP-binding protein [Planotetraspora kaengkrachanensis]